MTDLISRADAIEAVQKVCETIDKPCTDCTFFYDGCLAEKQIKALPSADAVSRESLKGLKFVAIKGDKTEEAYRQGWNGAIECIIENVLSADAEPKWTCTANFVAEQLERLKDMTDEERLKLLQTMFLSAETADVYKAHEEEHLKIINRIKELQYAIAKTQTIVGKLVESADSVQGEWIEKGGELVCSVCGNSVSFSRTPKGWVLGKFCQSCGARMKGGAE